MSRRIAASVAMLLGVLVAGVHADAADTRGYAPGKWFLSMDGHLVGGLLSVETTEVVVPAVGSKPRAAAVKGATAIFRVATGMSREFYDWLGQAAAGTVQRRNLSIDAADYNYKLIMRDELFPAAITEIDIPALDAASRNPGYLGVHVAAESSRRVVSNGGGMVPTGVQALAPSVPWLTSGYRLTIGALDGKAVTHVDPVVIRTPFNPDEVTGALNRPGPLKPMSVDLRFVVQGAAVEAYAKLLGASRQNGAAGAAKGFAARLDLLAPNGSVIYTFGFPEAYVTELVMSRRSAALTATIKLNANRVTFAHEAR